LKFKEREARILTEYGLLENGKWNIGMDTKGERTDRKTKKIRWMDGVCYYMTLKNVNNWKQQYLE
jgi:hypothetical protein